MKRKNISQGRNMKALFVVLFLVFGIFTLNVDKVEAAGTCQCQDMGTGGILNGAGSRVPIGEQFAAASDQECNNACSGKSTRYCYSSLGPCLYDHAVGGAGQAVTTNVKQAAQIAEPVSNFVVVAIKWVLVGVLNLVGWLFAIATTLFAWVVDPVNVSGDNGMLNKQAVKDVWIMVRDLLNMTFILILLFAAFCTIFQVDKWNLKKVWLNILINSLLVNFSYPIARFIIDISNVAFYYFLNNLFSPNGATAVTGNSIFASFGGASNIGNLLKPENYAQYDIAYLVAIIVVLFIMGMTLIVIAILFVVRLVALTMLVMFSPVGFVGYIFPATSKYADEWWNNLFSYSFFAPIMIFVMAIALRITEALGKENINTFKANAQANATAADANWISQAAFFVIPIVILWAGIGIAKKFGIAGADTVVNAVKKGGKWLANAPGHYSGAYGGAKLGWESFKKKGTFGSNAVEMRSAKFGRLLGDKHAVNDVQAKRLKDASDHHDTANMTEVDLQNLERNGGQFEKAAAILELANRGKANAANVEDVKKQFGDNSRVFNQIRNKVKTYDPTAAFATQLDASGKVVAFDGQRMKEHLNSNQFDAKKVNSAALGNAEFVEMAMTTGNMKAKDLEELAGKGKSYSENIKKSLKITLDQKIVDSSGNTIKDKDGKDIYKHSGNMKDENQRAMHMAFMAQNGTVHEALMGSQAEDSKQRDELFGRAGKDDLKRIKKEFLENNPLILEELTANVNPAKIKEILSEMNKDSQKYIINHIKNTDYQATNVNANSVKRAIMRDPLLGRI